MRRWVLVAFAVCCSTAAGAAFAEESATATQSEPATAASAKPAPSAEAIDGAFSALVMLGDKARRQGQITDAVTAYREALALHDDATVTGRLGLLYALADAPEMAARNLLEALERGGGQGAEKEEFFKAFKLARPRVCLLHVRGNVFDAEVAVDDGRFSKEFGPVFKLFVMPGKHVIRGRSKDAGDIVVEQVCPAGGEETAVLKWKTARTAPLRLDRLLRDKRKDHDPVTAVDIPRMEDGPAPREPSKGEAVGEAKSRGVRGAVGVGPTVVLGVATWTPAVGATVSGSVSPSESFSIGLDVRAAWLASGIGGEPIYAMTAGALLGACGHWRWLFGCGVGHLGFISVNYSKGPFAGQSFTAVKPGFGVRAGARWSLAGPLSVQVSVDALGLTRNTRVKIADDVVAEQPAVLLGATASGVWQF